MFNKSQIEAISHKEGPAIVLAGPGSGKTTVITHRIKNLIENEGVLPEKIMVVTFTKAAAVHMKERFLEIMQENTGTLKNSELCANKKMSQNSELYEDEKRFKNTGPAKSYPVTFGTFHSIYYRILRLAYNYKSDSIVSDRMKYDFLKEIVIRLKLDVNSLSDFIQNVSAEISKVKGNMWKVDDYNPGCCKSENFQKIYYEYEKTLEAERKIDFEDMLLKCYKLLKERPDILKQWQEAFQYILIDEFQDIDRAEYEIIKLLALPENNIFIVGDDDQSIYGFRGSSPQIMFQFQKDYPRAKEILLNVNYRSTPEIVKLSQNLISHNHNRFEKEIISSKRKGLYPDVRKFQNQGEELKYMCQRIKNYIKEGISPDEIGILVRNNSQIPAIKDFIQNEMLEVQKSKNENIIYQGIVAGDIISYIKAALCDISIPLKENEGLIHILNKPSRYISRQVIGQEKMNFDELKRVYCHNREVLKNIEQLQFHLQMMRQMNPFAAVTYIRNGTGYEKYLQQYSVEKNIKLSGLLKQLDNIQKDALRFDTLGKWLNHIDNLTIKAKNTDDKSKSGIQILTMHGSKGLEFTAVFIIDANQGIIPSSRTVRERDFQEERRIFYVAMTRAAGFLHIYGVMERLGCPAEISMFVEEAMEPDRF